MFHHEDMGSLYSVDWYSWVANQHRWRMCSATCNTICGSWLIRGFHTFRICTLSFLLYQCLSLWMLEPFPISGVLVYPTLRSPHSWNWRSCLVLLLRTVLTDLKTVLVWYWLLIVLPLVVLLTETKIHQSSREKKKKRKGEERTWGRKQERKRGRKDERKWGIEEEREKGWGEKAE